LSASPDAWSSGNAYDAYIGRWSRLVAREFLDGLAVPRASRWLDVGCGTGALTRAILDTAHPKSIVGVDPSPAFLEVARGYAADARATFEVGDAQRLSQPDASCDAVVSALAINFVPDPARGIAEMARVAVPDGAVALYVWDYAERMGPLRRFWDAAVSLDPAARDLDESVRFPLCRREPLEALFRGAGLRAIEVRRIDVVATFADFEDYWRPFLGGQGPAPGYVGGLPEEGRARLRDRLRERLSAGSDGAIVLNAGAWAVQARR
jgi:SAM-dependent methyltransferase